MKTSIGGYVVVVELEIVTLPETDALKPWASLKPMLPPMV